MSRNQAKPYIIGGVVIAIGGFAVAGPSVPNFWLWMCMPAIMVAGGAVRLLRK